MALSSLGVLLTDIGCVIAISALSVTAVALSLGDGWGRGGYLPRPKSTRGWFAGAVQRSAIQAITPHDLRHTCASLAASAGVNVLALKRMLGHTSAKVTLDTYTDLFDTDLDAVGVTPDARYSPEIVGTAWAQGGYGDVQQP